MLAQNISIFNIPWHEAPLNLLTDEQQLQLKQLAQVTRYTMGQVLWSSPNPDSQRQIILVLSGEVRLVQEKGVLVEQGCHEELVIRMETYFTQPASV